MFITYLYTHLGVSTFLSPLAGLTQGLLTEAGPLTLSEKGTCQLLPEKEGSTPGKGWGPFGPYPQVLVLQPPGKPGQEGAAS